MSKTLRILTLSTLFPSTARPGFGIFVGHQTATLAARDDVEVKVCAPIGLPPPPFDRHSRYRDLATLPEHDVWQGLSVWRPRFTLIPKIGGRLNPHLIARAILPGLREQHQREPFDLIDAEFFYPDGPAAMSIAQELGLPFTIKARGSDIHHWLNESGCTQQILDAAQAADRLFAVSAALKADMQAAGMDPAKIMIHYTGLDRTRFHPGDRAAAKAALGIEGPLIISVGALIERKRHRLAIEALTEIPDATLMIVGDGPLRDELPKMAQQLGVGDRVLFTGQTRPEDMPQLVRAADLSILVSESEGLANAWVEALACGVPLIAADVGGVRELIRSEVAGRVLATDTDATTIAEVARQILADPPASADVAAQVAHLGWDRNAEQLEAAFREIIENRGSGARRAA